MFIKPLKPHLYILNTLIQLTCSEQGDLGSTGLALLGAFYKTLVKTRELDAAIFYTSEHISGEKGTSEANEDSLTNSVVR